ncbi:antichymotrypsin-2-like isoform X2 [Leptidea sinapis]|uniref:antichymotrypsin-2-like isoform X2 n=1 Tax=Leptidea sinapis TaxID=189913 RepID=UPI0021C26E0C|nr:antichymotrypsin-2-like isoform X2 [Leptidea sinapis]
MCGCVIPFFLKPAHTNMDSKALSTSIAKFSAKFCNQLEKTSVVSSPLSAEYLLALLALGSEDPAHSELLKSLGLPDDDAVRTSFTSFANKLKSIKGITLNIANKVYIQEGDYDLSPALKNDAVKVFDAGLEKMDFTDSSAAGLINKWVESKTNERIKDLLSPDSLNSDTRLVLVNALYFKGTWVNQFDPIHTMDQAFHIDANTTVDVPMMFIEEEFLYGEDPAINAQFLQMHYAGEEASMLIVLPREVDGVDDLLTHLADGYDLVGQLDKLHRVKVKVTIPKFKIETEIDLKSLLPKMGVEAIFDPHNSGINKLLDNGEMLHVSKAVQKAFIEVNEEGAEAAAATAGGLVPLSEELTEEFVADHPFIAIINVKRMQYFWSVLRSPSEEMAGYKKYL